MNSETPYQGRYLPRGVCAENAAKTHCDSGHEFTPKNTYTRVDKLGRRRPSRACRHCNNARSRRATRKKRAAQPK